MKGKFLFYPLFFLFFFSTHSPLWAEYLVKDGKLVNKKYVASMSVEEHYSAAEKAFDRQDWRNALRHYNVIVHSFPDDSITDEVRYKLGLTYFRLGDYDMANRSLINYFEFSKKSEYFEDAVRLRLDVADKFARGAKKHLFGFESTPELVGALDDAVEIYKEVAKVLPNHSLAAHALYAQGQLHLNNREYKEAHETFQSLLVRFPKHELAPQTYVALGALYLEQLSRQAQNSDLLELAEINIRKFREHFPLDERVVDAEKKLSHMRELYAEQLIATGRFYERKKKPKASVVYYVHAFKNFPKTKAAKDAKQRLQDLKEYVIQLGLSEELLK